jgi:hypothetical protein
MLHPKTSIISIKRHGQLPRMDGNPPPLFTACAPNLSSKQIRVARKVKGKKQSNVFLDDHGYPDQSHEFDGILHNVKGGLILHRHKHPALPIDDIDPHFLLHYDEARHRAKL